MSTFADELSQGAEKLGIKLDTGQTEAFLTFKSLLLEWNEKMNLTAITDEREILVKHFLDSLSIVQYIPENAGVVDIGTGAGFPGVPIIIARPDLHVLLMDSLKKRLTFLDAVIGNLGLSQAETVHIRAEDAGHDSRHRVKYDVAVSRAVAGLGQLTEYAMPLVKPDGLFISMKGPNAGSEISEAMDIIAELGGELSRVDTVAISGVTGCEDITRTIISIRKVRHTPSKYPRNPSQMAKIYKK